MARLRYACCMIGSLLACEIFEQPIGADGSKVPPPEARRKRAPLCSVGWLLQILGLKAGFLRYLRKEAWADFGVVVKCEEQRGQQLLRLDRPPATHVME